VAGVTALRALVGGFQALALVGSGAVAGGALGGLAALVGALLGLFALVMFVAVPLLYSASAAGWLLGVASYGLDAALALVLVAVGVGAPVVALAVDALVLAYLLLARDAFGTDPDARPSRGRRRRRPH
jgi:hypothetical protein